MRVRITKFKSYEGLTVTENWGRDLIPWGDDNNIRSGDRVLITHKGILEEEVELWELNILMHFYLVVYYESINRELKIKPIYECRCDERRQTKTLLFIYYESIKLLYDRGTGTPKDRDEVNNREVCEWDGWVCDWEVIGTPLRFRLIRKEVALARIFPDFDFSIEENAPRRKWKYDDPKFDCADWTPEAYEVVDEVPW